MDVTASFLEGAILSWALPLALLIVVTIWWVGIVVRSAATRATSPVATSPADPRPRACRRA